MGEAKSRLERLGSSRDVHVERDELFALVNYICAPVPGPNGTQVPRATKNGGERAQLRSALRQIGALALFREAKKGTSTPTLLGAMAEVLPRFVDKGLVDKIVAAVREHAAATAKVPEAQVRDVSVDAINYLQANVLTDMDNRTMLELADFEERLQDAKDGTYEVPGELREQPATPEPIAEPAAG